VIRRYVLALSLLALPVVAVVASTASANASVRPHAGVKFTGSVSCSITGSIKASPPLLLTTPQTTTITLTASAKKCTGNTTQGGVTLKTGAISGKVTAKNVDCESLLNGVPNPTGKISWKGTGGTIQPTTFVLSNGSASFGASSTTITFTSTQKGSFKGSGAASATVNQTEDQLISECEGSGIAKLVISSGKIS
jgi:hypothetical protein